MSDASAAQIFSRLGRKAKLALAERDQHAMRQHTADLSHATGADVLSMCDRYARGNTGRR